MRELREKYGKLFEEELFGYCAPFWLKYGFDREYGGISNCIDRKGEIYSSDKSVWMQGRTAFTYSHLYRAHRKDPEYLALAKSCIDFENKYCIDADGRMFFTVTRDGRPIRKRRYFFSETFYIIANAEYYAATGDVDALSAARKYFDFVCGIYRDPSLDPYKITPKAISSTRDMKSLARPMILLNVASVMAEDDPARKEVYDRAADGFIRDIRDFWAQEEQALLENMPTHGGPMFDVSEGRIVNPGHDAEASWFLLEAAEKRNDGELAEFAARVFDSAVARGLDREYGGLFYFKDVSGKPVEAYEHDMKLWWPHNEAVIASLMFYRHTGDKKYKELFEMFTDYAFSHFSDREYGEWLGYLRRDGKPTEPPCKGHTYKGAFHVMRMLYKVTEIFNGQIG